MIELINVSKEFKDKVLFKDVTFKINKPGIYTFVGDNGVGKSTLLNIINKSINVSKGKVINKIKERSFLSQSVSLIEHLTIKEHFDMFHLKYDLLKKFKLFSKLNSYPKQLSYGEKQRINCIIGLYNNSSLLILDEPTSHLDITNKQLIMKEIKKVSKYKIVLMVSHDMDIISKYSDYIFEIKNKELSSIKEVALDYRLLKRKMKFNFKKYIKKSIIFHKKNSLLFCIIIMILSFTLIISRSISYSLNNMVRKEVEHSLDYNKFYLKECDRISKEGFVIKKCRNLSEDKLEDLKEYKVGYNYDILLNSLYDSDKFIVVNNKDVKLKEGRYPLKHDEIITSDNHQIGDVIQISSKKIISLDKTDIYIQTLDLKVVGTTANKLLFNEDRYYLDYDLIEEYLKRERLINNDIDLYAYYKELEIDSYKYVLYFNDIDLNVLKINNIDYLSSSYDYYNNLEEISFEIKEYFKWFNFFAIPLCIYYFIRLLKKRLNLKEGEISFLLANGVNKRKTIKLIIKEQRKMIAFCYFVIFILVNILIFFILRCWYANYFELILVFLFVLIGNNLLTRLMFKRRSKVC